MVIHTTFAIQRQSRLMACRDKLWSSTPLLSRDNQVRWHTETNYGHLRHLSYLETIKSHGTRRQIMVIHTFAIQRHSSPMAHGEKSWSSTPPLLSRDNQVRWHAETSYGHPHRLCYPETIKSDDTWRQIMVICPFSKTSMSFDRDYCSLLLPSKNNQVRWHAETN